MSSRLIAFLTSPWLTVRVQIALGLFFVVASLPKLVDPPSFAHMIYNYRIVPGFAINAMAIVMPWLELLSGLALIMGIWRKPAAAIIGAMLCTFIVAISINLLRDHAIDCGCFDVHAAPKTRDEQIADMWFVIWRDLGMLVLVAQILWSRVRQGDGAIEVAAAIE